MSNHTHQCRCCASVYSACAQSDLHGQPLQAPGHASPVGPPSPSWILGGTGAAGIQAAAGRPRTGNSGPGKIQQGVHHREQVAAACPREHSRRHKPASTQLDKLKPSSGGRRRLPSMGAGTSAVETKEIGAMSSRSRSHTKWYNSRQAS